MKSNPRHLNGIEDRSGSRVSINYHADPSVDLSSRTARLT